MRGVRLVGGSRCSGRVEVLHGESWYTVCDADFDQQDAEVVCRELGCGLPVEVLGGAAFGRGEGQVWSEELQCRGNESQTYSCPTSPSLKHNCSHESDVGLVCAGSVRLVDGGSRCAGRVEVLHRGQWGTVCGDNWDMRNAAVVCRELVCGEAVDALSDAHFGPGSGPIWMDDVDCTGSESTLKNCRSSESSKRNCDHSRDAGVICSGVRLVGGSHCSGRVEMLHGETWYTVCDADFDQQDAEVVCRELGCGLPVEVLGGAAFGRGEDQVWSEELQCRGNESQIHSCPTSPSLKHNCSHDSDVGLVCAGHRKSRLTGGPHLCSGRVDVLQEKNWYTVCDADFDQQDAEVVCRELGCGRPVEVLGGAAFGRGEGQVWSEELQCRGDESEISFCSLSSSLRLNYTHDSDVGIICSGHTGARLVNGSDSCSGGVELQYLSEWGTVCDVSWDMRAASVLCGQLKCGSAVAVVSSDWFGEGRGRIWADVFDCQGNETHLSQCPISSWSRTCSHKQDAGVICSGSSLALHEGRVRLSGGTACEGEVEVYFMQEWRRVLLDSWSGSVASVVCRQLGCGSVFSFSSSSPSSPEHSHTCVTGFNCSGNEAHLGNCSRAQAVNCSSGEQLYITCSAHSSIRLVGSGGDCAGRLEVYRRGSWGTVSDDLWDIKDAQVVCRQLQCGVALNVPVPAQFGPGTGPVWLNEVECEGNETSLWNCRFQLCGENECGHKEDVGVMCSELTVSIRLPPEYKEIRLTEGCEGNLEVFYNGTWGNVCVNDMNEETCPSSPWGQNDCANHDEVAHITCSDYLPLRLSGGEGSCSGRLEVYYDAEWGSVCDDQWDMIDAQVVCRQLGCGQALSANRSSVFGAGNGPVWLNRVKCRGNEIHLWDCPHSLKNHTDCSHRQHAGVTCTGISVSPTVPSVTTITVGQTEKEAVTLSETPSAALPPIYPVSLLVLGVLLFLALVLLVVLLYQNRRLRRVLSKRRRKTQAEAVYEEVDHRLIPERMTQTGSVLSEAQHSGYEDVDEGLLSGKAVNEEKPEYYNDVTTSDLKGDVGKEDTPENYDDVITAGQILDRLAEDKVETYDDVISAGENPNITSDAVYTPEGYDDVITAGQDVGGAAGLYSDSDDVMSVLREVRLVGGSRCSGRVEVLHGETWYTVCDADFDQQDAKVVCRELGCGLPVEVLGGAAFGRGEGQVWSEELQCRGNESQIHSCPSSSSLKHNCSHDSDVGLVCAGFDSVRLVDGGGRCAGRVEVLHRGQWGTVCGDNWDMRDAAVVCRELGCGEAVDALSDAHFGPGSGPIWMNDVDCRGSEALLKSCRSRGWGKHNCDHSKDAGVICSEVRLVGGSHCSGRVEVLHGETWYTVCDADFDQQDAEVVCRELGCGLPVEVLGGAAFGRGEGQVWSEELQCRGDESQIHSCPTSPSLKHNCSHDSDVGLVCAGVRLVGGSRCSGRVEVLHGESWYTVCDADFDQQDAEVVCQELGCGLPVKVLGGAAFGRGEGQVWSEELQCRGNESQIHSCPTSPSLKHNCSHDRDVGLMCAGSVRLVDGGSRCAGRVEVLHRGQWGTVCGDNWDMRDAAVVCRELGCGEAVDVLSDAHFGPGSGPIWMDDVDCSGSESTLKSCSSLASSKHNCDHSKDAGVICSEVRLVGGSHCSGRVEVLHGETWYTVCDADFDQQDAEVVCRELGCGLPVEVLGGAAFGRGEGQVWSEELQCRGNESQIHSCPTSPSLKHNCSHDSDVGLVCAGHRKSRLTDGAHTCSGRVEVLLQETWYTACDADFDQQDAEVVCRELGCGLPVEVLGGAAFGRGEGQVWKEELQCRGDESEISLCPTSSSLSRNCTHDRDVGLICSGHTAARLVNSMDSCSGRVELQYLSEWGTVCDVSWDVRAASVLCGQLKCGSAVAVVGSDWFGEGSGRIWADLFDCQGNETHLSQCPISSWSRAACSHYQDAGVICSGSSLALHEGRVRLSGGMECEGEVEVYFRQDWRRVLLESRSESVASVVCRQLGCGSVLNFSNSPKSSPGQSGHMCLMGFSCIGSEAYLGNCSSAQTVHCSFREQLSVTCSVHSSIRLVGSGGDCAGRLEVFHRGSWGTVSDDLWGIKDAQVVCRQLQCGVAISAPVPAQFGPGTGPIWLNEVECEGNETSLWNCRFQLCGEDECGHKEDVGVVCSEYKEIRLTEGCEGNLEVFYNGTWGNVCVNGMNEETVSLVCQELNCGRSGSERPAKARVESAPNWLDNLKCRKHDSTLWQCPSSPWRQNSCDHRDEVARITCSGEKNHPVLESLLKCSSSTNQGQCSNHLPLRLSGGEGSCSGRLEVYHNAEWGSVCDDLWDIRDAQVVCRQLGCGSALSADGSSVFGAGSGPVWLNRVKCRGNEIHLWDCPHSLKNHTNCSHRQHAGVTCAVGRSTKGAVTPQPVVPSIYPVSLLVLGVLLFLVLVLLVVLLYQNRRLRRVLSKRRRKTLTEAVYEEIDQRLIRKRMTQMENRVEIYDDAISAGENPHAITGQLGLPQLFLFAKC
ncbi:hypothetical protein NFI96_003105 [Prochilodus magdalenae]|nr:hypothetical protein NFI96_003105 [Prochilodus magdalenae]